MTLVLGCLSGILNHSSLSLKPWVQKQVPQVALKGWLNLRKELMCVRCRRQCG
jgi:hypothetical protein